MSEIAGLGLLIGNFIGAFLCIYLGSMLVGWLLKALAGEALSWARAEPGEEGYMKRMWVTHWGCQIVCVNGLNIKRECVLQKRWTDDSGRRSSRAQAGSTVHWLS